MNTRVYVFYGLQLYSDTAYTPALFELPDGAYIYYPAGQESINHNKWFKADLTPVLLEDVPKPLRALVLLMGIGQ